MVSRLLGQPPPHPHPVCAPAISPLNNSGEKPRPSLKISSNASSGWGLGSPVVLHTGTELSLPHSPTTFCLKLLKNTNYHLVLTYVLPAIFAMDCDIPEGEKHTFCTCALPTTPSTILDI